MKTKYTTWEHIYRDHKASENETAKLDEKKNVAIVWVVESGLSNNNKGKTK